jgi:DUF1365 family protein
VTANSALYVGTVTHERARPRRHSLRYRIFMLLLDLDELAELDLRLKRFSRNRFNILSFFDRDHLDESGAQIRPAIEASLAAHGIALPAPAISVLCMPRVFGHGFNPLTVYFCRDAEGRLAAIVYAVRNTFGQRHDYVLPVSGIRNGWVAQGCDKRFYVSPFLPMDLRYAFEVAEPGERVLVGVDVHDADGLLLAAGFEGARRPLTDATLMKAVLTHPWQVIGVMAAIHWEAVKIVLKGFRFFPQPCETRKLLRPALGDAHEKGGAG